MFQSEKKNFMNKYFHQKKFLIKVHKQTFLKRNFSHENF